MDWSVWAIKLPDIQIFIFLIGLEVGVLKYRKFSVLPDQYTKRSTQIHKYLLFVLTAINQYKQ